MHLTHVNQIRMAINKWKATIPWLCGCTSNEVYVLLPEIRVPKVHTSREKAPGKLIKCCDEKVEHCHFTFMSAPPKKPSLLVIESANMANWYDLCAEFADEFVVEQANWEDISLCSYSSQKGATVTLFENKNSVLPQQHTRRTIVPDLVLVRSLCRGIGGRLGYDPDYRNTLYGFVHSCTPMINGFDAVLAEIEKPIMYGRLRSIELRVGHDVFPLIEQYYYPESKQMILTPETPFVLKVSYPHAGYGKIRVKDIHDWQDLASIVALHKDYSVTEPLIETQYELRIAYIAPDYYRVHKRSSAQWKVNFRNPNVREDVELTPRWKKWVDLIVEAFPDMETFAIDALVDKDGREYILEVNGSSQGFGPEHMAEDLQHMRDLAVSRLRQLTGTETADKKEKKDKKDKKDKKKSKK